MQFLVYIKKYFNINLQITEIKELWKKYKNDTAFLMELKKYVKNNARHYKERFSKKVKIIKKIVSTYATEPIKSILDIGTENSKFLDELEVSFKNCKVRGINIKSGFNHYNEFDLEKDKRFSYYEKYIKHRNNDLIILLSVLHHIENIDDYLKEFTSVAKYIFIKEHDLSSKEVLKYYHLQHIAYEEVFTKTPHANYRRTDMCMKFLTDKMKNYSFTAVYYEKVENFVGTFYALFKSNSC